jgi:hypothetical protein
MTCGSLMRNSQRCGRPPHSNGGHRSEASMAARRAASRAYDAVHPDKKRRRDREWSRHYRMTARGAISNLGTAERLQALRLVVQQIETLEMTINIGIARDRKEKAA